MLVKFSVIYDNTNQSHEEWTFPCHDYYGVIHSMRDAVELHKLRYQNAVMIAEAKEKPRPAVEPKEGK